jgi:hypothetical protein
LDAAHSNVSCQQKGQGNTTVLIASGCRPLQNSTQQVNRSPKPVTDTTVDPDQKFHMEGLRNISKMQSKDMFRAMVGADSWVCDRKQPTSLLNIGGSIKQQQVNELSAYVFDDRLNFISNEEGILRLPSSHPTAAIRDLQKSSRTIGTCPKNVHQWHVGHSRKVPKDSIAKDTLVGFKQVEGVGLPGCKLIIQKSGCHHLLVGEDVIAGTVPEGLAHAPKRGIFRKPKRRPIGKNTPCHSCCHQVTVIVTGHVKF